MCQRKRFEIANLWRQNCNITESISEKIFGIITPSPLINRACWKRDGLESEKLTSRIWIYRKHRRIRTQSFHGSCSHFECVGFPRTDVICYRSAIGYLEIQTLQTTAPQTETWKHLKPRVTWHRWHMNDYGHDLLEEHQWCSDKILLKLFFSKTWNKVILCMNPGHPHKWTFRHLLSSKHSRGKT